MTRVIPAVACADAGGLLVTQGDDPRNCPAVDGEANSDKPFRSAGGRRRARGRS